LASALTLAAIAFPLSAGAVLPSITAFNEPLGYGHYWNPSTATVVSGGSVKFSNPYTTTYHGLKFTGGSAGATPTCSGIPQQAGEPVGAFHWEGECTFTKVGTYTFICTVHPLEMTGTITVTNGEPTVTTQAASAVSESEATLNGQVNPNGKATKYFFKWGTTESYGEQTSAPAAIAGSSAVSVSATLKGLAPGTLYHYRLVAENEQGSAEGADRTFTTLSPPGPPTALTSAASAVTETTATLKGSVNPNGQATEYTFEWGTTSAYSQLVGPLSVLAEDRVSHPESATIEGLLPGTVYHFRLVAHNASASSPGLDSEFTTLSRPSKEPPPSEPPPAPSPGPTGPEPTVSLIAPPTQEKTVSFGPALIGGSLKLSGHGSSVRGSIGIGLPGAGGRLEIDLLAKPGALGTRGSKPVVVGRFVRVPVQAGTLSFSASLSAKAKAAMRRHRRLALSAKVTLTPHAGAVARLTRTLTLRG